MEQARAIEDPSYVPSNPITRARGQLKLARSADPKETLLADLRKRVDRLEATEALRQNQPPTQSDVQEVINSIGVEFSQTGHAGPRGIGFGTVGATRRPGPGPIPPGSMAGVSAASSAATGRLVGQKK
jgi:hypothetical protein